MAADVVVTGYGVRTAFGDGAAALRGGVFAGRQVFQAITRFDTAGLRTHVAACAEGDEAPSLSAALDNVAEAAVAMARLPLGGETAFLVGAAGDFAPITRFWRSEGADLTGIGDTVPSRLTEALATRFRADGPRLTFTTACAASAVAIIHGCRLIATGVVDRAVCVGGYLVERENQAKFDSGWALSADGTVRPFDAARSGLLLGDGAAAVVLESASSARSRPGAAPLARVAGWGMASDAHHVAQPHPEARGLVAAARSALRRAGDALPVGYVNAHGTATKVNDPAETRGFHELFGELAYALPISSTKGATGHMLEGSGVVEFVITLITLLDGVVPPTVGLTAPDPTCDLDYVPATARPTTVRRALTVNAAFGGVNTALVVEEP